MKKWLRKILVFQLMSFLLCWVVTAQEITLSGKVTLQNGEPMPGASVIVKGTSIGTITDANGNFSLSIPEGSEMLVISFIGMKTQEVPVTSSRVYNIVLEEDVYALEEVVAVGYGTVKKSDLTGSVASVKSEDISAFPTSNVARSLQGRAAGVIVQQNTGSPDSPIQIRIRGTNSIMGSNDPLWIIDGFPGDQSMLNNADIESIEILKDASATAIYGSRGANGVILVTTKQGVKGVSAVNYEGSYSIHTLRKKLDLMNAKEYAQFVNLARANDNEGVYFSDSEINSLGEGTDWQDLLFREAPVHQHSLSINGGNDKTQFLVSGSYFDQAGIIKNSDYRRINLRANIDHKISNKFDMSFNAVFTRSDDNPKNSGSGNRGGSLISSIVSIAPTLSPYNYEGTY
jgi:TonB-linked SusC/RagA family outer membrane protein